MGEVHEMQHEAFEVKHDNAPFHGCNKITRFTAFWIKSSTCPSGQKIFEFWKLTNSSSIV